MPLSTAQALVPGLVIVPADPAADAASLERLAVWVMQRLSPIVAPDPPDGIVLDTTGADHLQGGEAAISVPRYAQTQVTDQFSFLRRALSGEDLFATAATMGITALAVVDRNSLVGIARA